ncbi:parasite-infected erythrocyte surface protein, putative [Plasmodium gallinaceum]|uniref:Parasite-infected erythrocyte surface protein, putative n=1 Tax=Plasmodium gallinaceum TaxID=5849 RepID=A0A1J1GM31_PLAGA|nr:parasite-infected erythrocyte surface protein, putative [Plasmodium gallinaceum]CRG93293.1 parasite-infected erythrocyte surface protein, putative [Plasmodium gallinaceum]
MKNYIILYILIVVVSIFLKRCINETRNTNYLPLHSFKSPFTINDLNNGWILDYSTTSTNEYLVLIPNVYNRRGLLYHDKPIISDSLFIEFSFYIRKKYYKESLDDKYYQKNDTKPIDYKTNIEEENKTNGFGLWILENEFSIKNANNENNELDENEFILYGLKKRFNGIGIFFQLKGNELIVSGFVNNGSNDISVNESVVKSHNFNSLHFNGLITVRVSLQNNEISVSFLDSKNSEFQQSISIKNQISKKNYIGFSAFNFKEDENIPLTNVNKYEPTFVGIKELRIFTNYLNEENERNEDELLNDKNKNDISANDLNSSVNDILKELSPHQDQINHTEALKTLTKIFQKFMVYQINYEKKLLQNIDTMKDKIQIMQSELKLIKKSCINKSEDPKHFQKIFTTELSGLKNLFHSHTQHHRKNIEDITNKLTKKIDNNQELKMLAEKAEKLENIINKGNSTTYIFSIGFAGLIITTLILIYKKIRDVEKKHIL